MTCGTAATKASSIRLHSSYEEPMKKPSQFTDLSEAIKVLSGIGLCISSNKKLDSSTTPFLMCWQLPQRAKLELVDNSPLYLDFNVPHQPAQLLVRTRVNGSNATLRQEAALDPIQPFIRMFEFSGKLIERCFPGI